jgi:hypothetical protein
MMTNDQRPTVGQVSYLPAQESILRYRVSFVVVPCSGMFNFCVDYSENGRTGHRRSKGLLKKSSTIHTDGKEMVAGC